MHASAAVVATATVSTAVHSSALLFTAAFHISRFACDVPMVLRGLFEVSSATANSAAPWCRHAHICCRRGNGDAVDCRALCGAALHDGLYKSSRLSVRACCCANGSSRSIRKELDDGGICHAVMLPCTYLLRSWQRRRFRLPCALLFATAFESVQHCSSRRPFIFIGSREMCQ